MSRRFKRFCGKALAWILCAVTLVQVGHNIVQRVSADENEGDKPAEYSALELYEAGNIEGAKQALQAELNSARAAGDRQRIWAALMNQSWFETNTGNLERSLEISNEALAVATEQKSQFMIGRSLVWIGLAYSRMGLYQLALEFFRQAVAIGAPEGKVAYPAVWGFAHQEEGAVLFRIGDLPNAKRVLEETTRYAREHGILVGVAEGGAHLAEIALMEGRPTEARQLSEEAVEASIKCGCNPANTARAKAVRAAAVQAQLQSDPALKLKADEYVSDAINSATQVSDPISTARAKLIASKLLPPEDFQSRYDLVSSAFELLANTKSDYRGFAEAQLGKLFLEQKSLELSEFYLKNGYKVNKELFRKVDQAFITADLADLAAAEGNAKGALEKLEQGANRAAAIGAKELEADIAERLSNKLSASGYDALAIVWMERSIAALDALLATEINEGRKQNLLTRKTQSMEKIVQLQLANTMAPERPQDLIN